MSVIAIHVGIIGMVVAGVNRAGGITITVMRAGGIGFITNRNHLLHVTGIMTTIGVKAPLRRTGMKDPLPDGARVPLRAAGNTVINRFGVLKK